MGCLWWRCVTCFPKSISIDIRPWSKRNPINYKGHRIFPVAIISTEDFDAPSQVDQKPLNSELQVKKRAWPSVTVNQEILAVMVKGCLGLPYTYIEVEDSNAVTPRAFLEGKPWADEILLREKFSQGPINCK